MQNTIIIHEPPHNPIKIQRHLSASQPIPLHMHPSAGYYLVIIASRLSNGICWLQTSVCASSLKLDAWNFGSGWWMIIFFNSSNIIILHTCSINPETTVTMHLWSSWSVWLDQWHVWKKYTYPLFEDPLSSLPMGGFSRDYRFWSKVACKYIHHDFPSDLI